MAKTSYLVGSNCYLLCRTAMCILTDCVSCICYNCYCLFWSQLGLCPRMSERSGSCEKADTQRNSKHLHVSFCQTWHMLPVYCPQNRCHSLSEKTISKQTNKQRG